MEKAIYAKRVIAAACAAVIASCALAGSAFAATVHGADFYGAGSALESGEVDVLNVDGVAGETVFLAVKQDGTAIAKNLPYVIGENANADDSSEFAGVATLDITNLDLNQLDGSYVVEAYADRTDKTQVYSGALYGVYADLPDGTQKLIGTRTATDAEAKARTFTPAETLYVDGKTYRLSGPATGTTVLHFPYEAYDEATTIDGVVKYVDANGNVVASTKIPGLKLNESRPVEIPSVITADDGSLYRTVFFQKSVTAVNPGNTSFSVYCVKMSEAAQALSGFYVATINMVDSDGTVIASDSVNVTGDFIYTAPTTIYKTETVNGHAAVVTYSIDQSPIIRLSAANDNVENRARTITVNYSSQVADEKEVNVTFNLVDGSKRKGEDGRSLGIQQVVATKDAPAKPEAQVEFNGTTYNIAGSPDDYAYEIGTGEVPSVDVYYTPEGYTAPGAYDVTVNYVNFLTNAVIESHVYTSDPDDNARITISTPETFNASGIDYVRLAGQEADIAHSYYSGIASYTVYYRDANDELASGSVVNKIRVVYEPGGTAAFTADGTTADDATDDGATALQLNAESTYNVMDGEDGNATLTNESGVDSNTERIEDSETPLASGFGSASSSAASSFTSISQWLLPIGIAVGVVIVAVVTVMVIRRRKNDEEYEL